MEKSILKGTKKVLGIEESYTAFDEDILMFINSAFSTLKQVAEVFDGFVVEDDSAQWDDLELHVDTLGLVRTYIYLKAKLMFDPPATSFHLDALNKQILEHEVRLNMIREELVGEEV